MPDQLKLDRPLNTLISYHYFKNENVRNLAANGLRLIGDSGAYSAESLGKPIDIDAFAHWATKWKQSLCWSASLDVIGDQDKTWSNFQLLRDKYNLDVVPTIHYGADPSALDKYAELGIDYVGLGGMVLRKSEPQKLMRWVVSVFKYARDNHPQMRFHGWGVTHTEIIMSVPWYSVDSTGWASSFIWGRLSLWLPTAGKFVGFQLDGKAAYKYADDIRQFYGVEPADIAKCGTANIRLVANVSAKSYQLSEAHLKKRFNVTAPTYGLGGDTTIGPNIHLANGSSVVFRDYLKEG